jgi:glycosyltransferase involved in cell wall biosynthesis
MQFNVSVIIPVFSAEPYLEKAINSALELEEVKEIILIEDGSTDDSLQICQRFAEKSDIIKLFNHTNNENLGAGASRNLGLLNATCDYIAFLDADDFFLPNRFKTDKSVLFNYPEADGVYNAIGVHYYTKKGKELYARLMDNNKLTTIATAISPDELFPALALISKYVGYFSLDGLTIKKEVLLKMDSLFNTTLRLHQDTEFIIRLAFYANLYGGNLTEAVTLRGVHDDNRILNLKKSRKKIISNQLKLWNSLVDWSEKENIKEQYQKHFKRMSMIYSLMHYNRKKTLSVYSGLAIKDKELFFKSSYYTPVHYYVFGSNLFSKGLLRVKHIIQKLFNTPHYQTTK